MSYLSDISAGGIDPLRDHRATAPTALRSVRVAARVVEAGKDGLTRVIDGSQDTLGDINCAAFWQKATRSISGWAFAWPAVVARGQVSSGGRSTPTTPRVTVTPDPHSPTGAGVAYSRSNGSAGGGTTAQTSTSGVGVMGGSGARASRTTVSGPGSGGVLFRPGEGPTTGQANGGRASASPTAGPSAHPAGFDPRIHWQDIVRPNAPAVPAGGGCSRGGNREGDPFNVGLGADGGQGGIWGVRFNDAANGGGGGVFGPNIGAGTGVWGAVFGWAATRSREDGGASGGTFIVGAQGMPMFGVGFGNWDGNGPRYAHGSPQERARGGRLIAGTGGGQWRGRGRRGSTWGARFGGF